MSNLIDLNELRKQFQDKLTKEEWTKFSEAQMVLITKYENQLKILSEKNKHLEQLLLNNREGLVFELTPEESICVQQIGRLEESSIQRPLTLEEVKKLDLLVKNLKLIREESTIILNNREQSKLEEKDLVAIIKGDTNS
jgi:hypothetical protein